MVILPFYDLNKWFCIHLLYTPGNEPHFYLISAYWSNELLPDAKTLATDCTH